MFEAEKKVLDKHDIMYKTEERPGKQTYIQVGEDLYGNGIRYGVVHLSLRYVMQWDPNSQELVGNIVYRGNNLITKHNVDEILPGILKYKEIATDIENLRKEGKL